MENKIIPAGTKIVINTYASIGAEDCTAYTLSRDYTEKELDDIAWQEGVQYAESYGIYPRSLYESMSEEELDRDEIDLDDECYSDDIEGWWELYDSKKHDGYLIFGNNITFTFNTL